MSTRSIVVVGPLAGLLLMSKAAGALHGFAAAVARWARRLQSASFAAARRWREQASHAATRVPGADEAWDAMERRRYVRRAKDAADLERRLRAFERDEVTAYRLSGWL